MYKYYNISMKFRIDFNKEKNLLLKETRGVGFDEAIIAIINNGIVDEFEHKDKKRHPNQRIIAVKIKNYIYAVPYIKDEKRKVIFLKTIYPSRILSEKYLKKGERNEK